MDLRTTEGQRLEKGCLGRGTVGCSAAFRMSLLALALALLLFPPVADAGRVSVGLNPPRLWVTTSADPDLIWPEGSSGEPKEARIALNITAVGDPSFTFEPQDTVFVMDRSGSMAGSDPSFLRVVATQKYVDGMIAPDRGCVVSFATSAALVNGHGLTSDYMSIRDDLATVGYSSGTNIEAALSAATGELESHGTPGKMQLEILLTDGIPDPPEANVTMATVQRILDRHITLYTIGLGSDLDESLLVWLANITGGRYYNAKTAEELEAIYMGISNGFKNYTAAMDVVIHEVLAPGVHLVPGSARPLQESSGRITVPGANLTYLDWRIPVMNLSQKWTASYLVTVSGAGSQPLRADQTSFGNNFARLDYINWSGKRQVAPLAAVELVGILPLPPPPPAFMPPTAPPPPPPPPPPPLLPVYSPAVPVAVQPSIVMVTQSSPPLYIFAPLLGLGAGRLLQKVKPHKMRGMGMASPQSRRLVRELVKERDKHDF